jgi:hypothetical protein
MRAMDWVQTEQAVDGNTNMEITETANPMEISDLTRPVQESIVKARQSIGKSAVMPGGGWYDGLRGHIVSSRAVHANGQFHDLTAIPRVFARVLVEGGKNRSQLENQERILTISGFLAPERGQASTD